MNINEIMKSTEGGHSTSIYNIYPPRHLLIDDNEEDIS